MKEVQVTAVQRVVAHNGDRRVEQRSIDVSWVDHPRSDVIPHQLRLAGDRERINVIRILERPDAREAGFEVGSLQHVLAKDRQARPYLPLHLS